MPSHSSTSLHGRLFDDLLQQWQAAETSGERQGASVETFFAEHPTVLARPELLAELKQAIADIERFDQLAEGRGKLPQIPDCEIVEELGSGGMGMVYLARQPDLDREVAVKVLHGGLWADPVRRWRFLIEAQAVAQLEHENIVRLYQRGEFEGLPYLVVELLRGGNLHQEWRERPPSPASAAKTVEILARAIHYAHRHPKRIVHRDLKPSNILLTQSGEPKVADFGLAKMLEAEGGLSQSGTPLGTARFMAPEQTRGQADERSDIYGLGGILYYGLTGRPPFDGMHTVDIYRRIEQQPPTPPRQVVNGQCGRGRLALRPRLFLRHTKDARHVIDRDIETICLKCLEKSPGKRYATADDLARDLRRYLDGLPIQARKVSLLERSWRTLRSNPLIVAVIVCLSLAVCAIAWALLRAESANREATRAIESLFDSLDENVNAVLREESLKSDALQDFRKQLLRQTRQQYAALIAPGRRMATADPQRIAGALQQIGQIEIEVGEKRAAAEAYEKAFAEWQRLADAHDEARAFASQRIECLCAAALAQALVEQDSEAQAKSRAALQIAQRRIAVEPNSLVARRDLARCRHTSGVLAYQRGDLPAVLAEMEAELPLRTQVVRETGAAEDYAALAENNNLLALGCHKSGRPDRRGSRRKAVVCYESALAAIQTAQQTAGPDDPRQITFRGIEAAVLSNKGMTDRNHEYAPDDPVQMATWTAGFRQAVQTFEQAVAVRRKLIEDQPAHAVHRQGLATALGNLADTYVSLAELANSLAPRREATQILRDLTARFPEVRRYRDGLLIHVVRLADTYHRLDRDAEAVRELRVLDSLGVPLAENPEGENPHQWILTAECWSLLAADEGAHPSPNSAQRQYSAAASDHVFAFIRTALDTGWAKTPFDAARLETDPAFDAYRHLPEFQQLLARCQAERQAHEPSRAGP